MDENASGVVSEAIADVATDAAVDAAVAVTAGAMDNVLLAISNLQRDVSECLTRLDGMLQRMNEAPPSQAVNVVVATETPEQPETEHQTTPDDVDDTPATVSVTPANVDEPQTETETETAEPGAVPVPPADETPNRTTGNGGRGMLARMLIGGRRNG